MIVASVAGLLCVFVAFGFFCIVFKKTEDARDGCEGYRINQRKGAWAAAYFSVVFCGLAAYLLYPSYEQTVKENEIWKLDVERRKIAAELRNENRSRIACEAQKLQLEQAGKSVHWSCD